MPWRSAKPPDAQAASTRLTAGIRDGLGANDDRIEDGQLAEVHQDAAGDLLAVDEVERADVVALETGDHSILDEDVRLFAAVAGVEAAIDGRDRERETTRDAGHRVDGQRVVRGGRIAGRITGCITAGIEPDPTARDGAGDEQSHQDPHYPSIIGQRDAVARSKCCSHRRERAPRLTEADKGVQLARSVCTPWPRAPPCLRMAGCEGRQRRSVTVRCSAADRTGGAA